MKKHLPTIDNELYTLVFKKPVVAAVVSVAQEVDEDNVEVAAGSGGHAACVLATLASTITRTAQGLIANGVPKDDVMTAILSGINGIGECKAVVFKM